VANFLVVARFCHRPTRNRFPTVLLPPLPVTGGRSTHLFLPAYGALPNGRRTVDDGATFSTFVVVERWALVFLPPHATYCSAHLPAYNSTEHWQANGGRLLPNACFVGSTYTADLAHHTGLNGRVYATLPQQLPCTHGDWISRDFSSVLYTPFWNMPLTTRT